MMYRSHCVLGTKLSFSYHECIRQCEQAANAFESVRDVLASFTTLRNIQQQLFSIPDHALHCIYKQDPYKQTHYLAHKKNIANFCYGHSV